AAAARRRVLDACKRRHGRPSAHRPGGAQFERTDRPRASFSGPASRPPDRRLRDQGRPDRRRAFGDLRRRVRHLPGPGCGEDRHCRGAAGQRPLLVRVLGAGLQPEARRRRHDRARRLRRRGGGSGREGDLLRVLQRQGAEAVATRPGASGGAERYCKVCCAISLKAGAATTPPQIAPWGSSTATKTTIRGRVAGAKPTNEATYFELEYPPWGSGFAAVPVLPATW